jgi:micrococcal nuclease
MSGQPRPERLIGIILVLLVIGGIALAIALASAPAASPATSSPERRTPPGGPVGTTERAEVLRVVDGDTIVVRIDGREERVRYIGIDAPELANAESGVAAECGAEDARAANARLVTDATLVLERDASDRDRFGRLLRHAWIQGTVWQHVGTELVTEGAVEARSYPPDTAHDAELDAAERRARANSAGMWGAC